MKTINELNEKWNSISPYSGGYLLISGDHPLSFHIGYEGDKRKTFIVLNTGVIKKIDSSQAVCVKNIETGLNQYALKFSLQYESLDEIFVKLCWDLMDASKNAEDPLKKLVNQYKKWLKLLQLLHDGLLSSSSQKGLIGELLFLEERIISEGDLQALNGWVGPEGSDQDFDYNQYWAEIKTTKIAGTTITVSSIQQLDRLDLGYLIVYHMDPTDLIGPQTVSLNEVVNRVNDLLSTDELKNTFECKLARVGFQMKDSEKYKEHRFRVSEKEIYEVTTSFPRLIKSNIPPEITEACYNINLPALTEFKKQEI